MPHASADLASAIRTNPALADEAAKGRTQAALRDMTMEAELRADLGVRADRFVTDWQRGMQQVAAHDREGDVLASLNVCDSMEGMAKSLERDPKLESLLRKRLPELGLKRIEGASLSHDLSQWTNHWRSRGLSR